ncbi:nitrous oxidase accessory protein [Thermoplasmatales archaeon SCGC AB-540-F20]|nr:nitrous oxidase accessory protein [Thermoplasmatales archaeon SCGC AB-540-F20]
MRKSMFRKGLVVALIVLFVLISINPITISRTNNYNTVNEEQSYHILNSKNILPVVNRTLPPDGAEDILVTGTSITVEIYDADDDDLWVEVWSNFTGNWVEYAGWDLVNESGIFILNNISSFIVVDFNEDGEWNLLDLTWLSGRDGWGQSGIWGFFENMSVTDDWGMTNYSTTYYWSVNITDNFTWTNVTYHFSTKSIGFDVVYVDDDFNESTPGWGYDHFDKVQDGIDVVNESGTVYVFNGTYYENVVIDITINLTGEDRNNTIIDGGGSGDVVYVSADWVNISGFTIQNSGSAGYPQYHSGIQIVSNFTNVSNNTIVDNNRGIWCRSDNNSILDNYIVSNTNQGLELYLCNHNLVQGNNLSYGTYGVKSDGKAILTFLGFASSEAAMYNVERRRLTIQLPSYGSGLNYIYKFIDQNSLILTQQTGESPIDSAWYVR